jgi:hypothetical protein
VSDPTDGMYAGPEAIKHLLHKLDASVAAGSGNHRMRRLAEARAIRALISECERLSQELAEWESESTREQEYERLAYNRFQQVKQLEAKVEEQAELIAVQYRVNEDMTKELQQAEAQRDDLAKVLREIVLDSSGDWSINPGLNSVQDAHTALAKLKS